MATCTCQARHDDHVSRGQGREDDDGGDRGEEDRRRGEDRAPEQETHQHYVVSSFEILNTFLPPYMRLKKG